MNQEDLSKIISENKSNILYVVSNSPDCITYKFENGIHFFPSDESCQNFIKGKKNCVWLNKLPNPKCQKCYGTGKAGEQVKVIPIPIASITKIFMENLDSTPDSIPDKILQLFHLPDMFRETLQRLVNFAVTEVTNHNLEQISDKYSKIVKEDFTLKEVVWCSCFTKKLRETITMIAATNKTISTN